MVAVEHGGVVLEEHLAAHAAVDHGGDLGIGGPDVLQVHVVAVRVGAERLGLEVEVHRAGERVGDDQRRGGQVVHLDVRADAASKLRLPESTAVTVRSLALIASEISGSSGPELPMQVAQPKPTSW